MNVIGSIVAVLSKQNNIKAAVSTCRRPVPNSVGVGEEEYSVFLTVFSYFYIREELQRRESVALLPVGGSSIAAATYTAQQRCCATTARVCQCHR